MNTDKGENEGKARQALIWLRLGRRAAR